MEITGINERSDEIKKGNIFVALKGTKKDGAHFIGRAYENGAVVVLSDTELDDGVPYIKTDNVRRAYARLCCNYYLENNLFQSSCAVTGTNGKTTVTYMLRHIFKSLNKKCCMVGSIENTSDGICIPSDMTTPDPPSLYKMLSEFQADGAEYLFIEASSHSLALDKLSPLRFDVGALTNITSDHLDFHKNREQYISAKAKLFTGCRAALINGEDATGVRISDRCICEKYFYSTKNTKADFYAENIVCNEDGISFDYKGMRNIGVKLSSPAYFNVYNALCATASAELLGADITSVPNIMESFAPPEGRCETVSPPNSPFRVIIDYSHTPDALENILKVCGRLTDGRLILVFGCGGDRDKEKRPQMGRVASRYADHMLITSDNCRGEPLRDIINDIMKGIDKNSRYEIIEDRKEAILHALDMARENDCVLLAGKGHEKYEITKDGKRPFSEKNIVKGWFSEA